MVILDIKAYQKEWYQKNKERLRPIRREYTRIYEQRNRIRIIALLGGKCVRCGETDWRCLQIDHINGGGRRAEAQTHHHSSAYMRIIKRLKQVKNPSPYQILCANCNWKKKYEKDENARRIEWQ